MMQSRKGILLVILGAICFSGSGVLSKFTSWSALATAGFRCIPAGLLMALFRGGFRIRMTKGNWIGALGCSSTSILFIIANRMTTAANAIVLQYAMPAVVILLELVIYRRKPTKAQGITCLLVLSGVILCSAQSLGKGNLAGDMLALFTAFTYALVFFCNRLPDAKPTDYNFLGILLGIPFALFAIRDRVSLTAPDLLAQLAMGVCLSVGYTLVSRGLEQVSPLTGALTSNIEPVLNPLWVFLFLGEFPGWLSILGAVIVLGTVTVYTLRCQRTGSM